jgi:hypothetical protein
LGSAWQGKLFRYLEEKQQNQGNLEIKENQTGKRTTIGIPTNVTCGYHLQTQNL